MGATDRLASELATLEGGAGALALPDAGLVQVSGHDHLDVLQRVLSQDLTHVGPGQGRVALLLTPKGQFRAVMAVFGGAGETLLLAPPGRGAEVADALSKFLLLSRCAVHAVADPGVAVVGQGWLDAAAAAGADRAALAAGGRVVWADRLGAAATAAADPAAIAGGAALGRDGLWFGRTLLGVAGATVVGTAEATGPALQAAGVGVVSKEAVELLRIRYGAPAWGSELTGTTLPPEVGIEGEAISYTKGCYIGQETMARMSTYGHPTRALAGVRQIAGAVGPPELPLPLTAEGEDRPRASLTSWGLHPRHGGVGLALVRRELAVPGTRLSAPDRAFEVAPFPLW